MGLTWGLQRFEFVIEKLTTLFFCAWWPLSDLQLWFSRNAFVTPFLDLTEYVYATIGHIVCLTTVSMTILFCIACNGGYSGWVLSASPIFKSLHHHLTFDISSKCNGYMTSIFRDTCVKVTPQSIWIHCKAMVHVWHIIRQKQWDNIRQRALRKRNFVATGFVMKVLWQDHNFVMRCTLNALCLLC